MIIDFRNMNGGGGSGYTLPVATSEVLGGVKIGSGITVNSAGTISVEGGSGVEVVSQLPASGTDGQVIVLEQDVPAFIVNYDPNTDTETTHIEVTGIGFTELTQIFDLEFFGEHVKVYRNEDGETLVYNDSEVLEETLGVGDTYTHEYTSYVPENGPQYASFTGTSTGFILESHPGYGLGKEYVYPKTIKPASKKCISYIWDTTSPTCDIYQKFNEEGNPHKNNTIVTYFGELPQNEIIFEQYHPYWDFTWYWAFDGEMIRAYSDTGMTNEEYWFVKPTLNSVKAGATNATFTDGLIVVNDYELNWKLDVYGNWADAGNGHWKPLDYEVIKTNALQLVDKTCSTRLYMPGVSDIYVEGGNGEMISMCLPNGFGTAGQMLMSQGNERPGKWVDYKPIGLADELPAFSTDGSFVIVNSGYQESATTAFLSYCTTDYNERNNFSDDTEMYWYADNYYVYFDPSGLTTTGKTFLYRIAMRTNENDNWNTSNLAYINVFREYDSVGQSFFYSWDMPDFDYYDTNGNPYTYSDSGVVNSNVTSANTAYLPIWKYWDGGYGYKFYFEYDTTTGGLKMWMRHCDPDGYPEGENYGEVPYECRNHTTEFYKGIDTEGNTSEVYTYRGGVWYKIGEFAAPV